MGPKTILLTGANRGIGLEFARQYSAAPGVRLYACCRSPADATELNELAAGSGGQVTVHALDQTNGASVDALASSMAGVSIDVLINNAAMNPDPSGQQFDGDINYEDWAATMDTNVFVRPPAFASSGLRADPPCRSPGCDAGDEGADADAAGLGAEEAHLHRQPRRLCHLPVDRGRTQGADHIQILQGKLTIAGIWVAFFSRCQRYRYRQAALNMVAKLIDVELAEKGLLSLIIHPGHVVTDMGGDNAPLTAPESVEGMVRCIEYLEPAKDGDANARFIWYDGRSLAW